MSSNFRIGGLSSGIDVDQIVSDLMKAQRARVDSIKQKRQQLDWKRADYRTINTSLATLRSSSSTMRLQSTFMTKSATTSNANVVAVTAGTTAALGSHTINVDWLAEGQAKGSQSKLAEETDAATGEVKTLANQFGIGGTINFTLQGKIGSDGLTRNSQAFSIDTTTATIETLVTTINSYSDTLGIRASYDSNDNRFFLSTTGTGTDYGINVTSDISGFLSDAGGAGTNTLNLLIQTNTLYEGKNAQFDYADINNMTSKSNTVTVNGITLNLIGAGVSTVNVTNNTDAIFNSIQAFITQYNTTLDLVNKELSEDKYKDFLPLTDTQREELTDAQEESWEEKAKSGMLKSDSFLIGMTSKTRNIMSSVVSGISPVIVGGKSITHDSLSAVGIATGNYLEQGKLTLKNDGADLKAAIENDLEGVKRLFTYDSETESEKGIARQLYNSLNDSISDIIEKAGVESSYSLYDDSTLGETLKDYDKRIDDWEDRLVRLEDTYWRRFTAMEKALNKMNSQSAWLSQQFSTDQ